MITTLTSLYILISIAFEQALAITDKILSGEIPADVAAISQLVSNQMTSAESSGSLATTIFIVTWLIGISDSYRVGKMQDNIVQKPV